MIELDNIRFCYRRKGLPALDGVTATLDPGIYLLAGENGAGKTTLLHIIAGVARPASGTCRIDSLDPASDNPAEKGNIFMLEENMRVPAKTIRKFAEIHSRFYPDFSAERFLANLVTFGLSGDEKLTSLSFGNHKKSLLAYALALGVDVLLLDEPTNGLDIQSKESLRRMIAECTSDHQTVIVATHSVNELDKLFDGAMIMEKSHLLYAATEDDTVGALAFRTRRNPAENALYYETVPGGALCIEPADGDDEPTRVDWRLLYSALHSPRRDALLGYLTKRKALRTDNSMTD